MFRSSHVLLSALVLGVLLLLASIDRLLPATAQSGGATIVGSVVDANLSPIDGVTVTLSLDGRVVSRTTTAEGGQYRFTNIPAGSYRLRAEQVGFVVFTRDVRVTSDGTLRLPVVLDRIGNERAARPDDAAETEEARPAAQAANSAAAPAPPPTRTQTTDLSAEAPSGRGGARPVPMAAPNEAYLGPGSGGRLNRQPRSGETYAHVQVNGFHRTLDMPLSTFGADVDTASYANVRRFLSAGQLPPADAVRVEEFVNYFRFDYAEPDGSQPIAITTEVGNAPWAPSHKLVLIGARASSTADREREGRNLVLLVDVSGSMAPADKLPLLKSALGLFVDTLDPDDRMAIVTYAGSSGLALPSTSVRRRDIIQRAIANLGAGGSTNGAQGLLTAYRVARQAFIPGGVNRVMLATDGDFNVGLTSQTELLRLIERERESGIFLSVLGVGTGNLRDSMMELIADHGNGHYAYLDSLQEAQRVLVREGSATLETVAKDVKFQVEFNPARVAAWRQIGYENRALAPEDFNDDRKDGGEMGAGHTVTVLYEIVPVGVADFDESGGGRPAVDPLRYQPQLTPAAAQRIDASSGAAAHDDEWLTVKARFKHPDGETSDLIQQVVGDDARVRHLPFASAVVEFGMLLREDRPVSSERWDALSERVGRLDPPAGNRAEAREFVELVGIARGLATLR